MLMNTNESYGLISRLFHWSIFIIVVGMLLGGNIMLFLPDGGIKSLVYSFHKSLGVLILFLMIVRLVWRIYNPRPKFLGTNQLLRYLTEVVHICLYVLLLVQPLAGILMSQAAGYSVTVFGVLEVPKLIWQSPFLAGIFRQIHGATATILMIFIAIHAIAALKHHYIDGDRTLMRMLKGN